MKKNFSINNKSQSTLQNYTRCLAHLALHAKESPEKLSKESINDYLFFCKNLHKTPSESFFKHTVYGLRAAYKVFNLEDKRIQLPQIKRAGKLPVVLSKEEVRRFIKAPKYLKHRLIIATLYGCGLRSYELSNLKLSDIDFDRMRVFEHIRKRYETGSIIITSNRNFEDRGNIFGDIVMASAIIDRVVHHAEIVKIKGDSYRTKNYFMDN